jgi:hypothetical protein
MQALAVVVVTFVLVSGIEDNNLTDKVIPLAQCEARKAVLERAVLKEWNAGLFDPDNNVDPSIAPNMVAKKVDIKCVEIDRKKMDALVKAFGFEESQQQWLDAPIEFKKPKQIR